MGSGAIYFKQTKRGVLSPLISKACTEQSSEFIEGSASCTTLVIEGWNGKGYNDVRYLAK